MESFHEHSARTSAEDMAPGFLLALEQDYRKTIK